MKLNFCAVCGITKELHLHHFIPKSKGGSDEETNLLTLCLNCHATIHARKASFSSSELSKRGMDKKRIAELIACCTTIELFTRDHKRVPSIEEVYKEEPELVGLVTKSLIARCLEICKEDPTYFDFIVFEAEFNYDLSAIQQSLSSGTEKVTEEVLKEMLGE